MSDNDLEQRQAAWQQRRQEELSAPDSWLGLIALVWLEPGKSTVGSAPGSTVQLPAGPPRLGTLTVEAGQVVWCSEAGVQVAVEGGMAVAGGTRLETDRDGRPTWVCCGDLAFFIMEREGRLAVRLRDRGWASRRHFAGLEYFPFDPAWRIEARWESLDPPQVMEVPNVTGNIKEVTVGWQAVFEVAGQAVALLPMEVGADGVFFILRDGTSGRLTYGAGRFLKTRPPRDGKITLDFNRAYNPPCAFTPFATCPLPPPQNWLPFAIPAGEKKYAGEH